MIHRLLFVALVAVVLGPSASAGAARGRDWLLLGSNRDGTQRAYSMRRDGSRLSPVVPSAVLVPSATTRDGRLLAYLGPHDAIYVSRADGTGLRRLVRSGDVEGFSPDGKLLAFSGLIDSVIHVVGTNGRGLRRLVTIDDSPDLHYPGPDWSPEGKAVVVATVVDEEHDRYGLVVQPLRGRRRLLVRSGTAAESDSAGIDEPEWSPDGRWISYVNSEDAARRNGLWVIHPNGRGLHRLAATFAGGTDWSPDGRWIAYLTDGDRTDLRLVSPDGTRRRRLVAGADAFAWSPDGGRLAVEVGSSLVVVDLHGRASARVRLDGLRVDSYMWSPDGRQLVLQASARGDPTQIWAVGSDGKGLHPLTNEGENQLVGFTALAPSLPPAAPIPPPERVLGADTVATAAPVADLSADGGSVAFITQATPTDCDHVAVWTPGAQSVARYDLRAPCGFGDSHVYGVELAGSRVAWTAFSYGETEVAVKSPSLARPVSLRSEQLPESEWPGRLWDFHVRGDGDLLVYGDDRSGLIRIDAGSEKCGAGVFCTTLRGYQDGHTCCPESVSAGLIAVREPGAVTLVDEHGKIVRVFPFVPDDVNAARLDGGRLVVWRFGVLEVYDAATGLRVLSQPMPAGYRLADVDGGIAVLLGTNRIMLLSLDDGRSLVLQPGQEPTLADLEPPGLYYSYATGDGGGHLAFMARAELERRLDGSAR